MNNERDNNGRFAPGNTGGPGRPRRAVEYDFLTSLANSVSLDDWSQVVSRAVKDAQNGDARARDWLSRYLLGNEPPQLIELAAREQRGATVDEIVVDLANKQGNDEKWAAMTNQLMGDLTTR